MDPEGVAAQSGASGDAHRDAVRIIVGQRVSDLACALPTQIRRPDVAVGRPCPGAHVPVEGGTQIPGGLQMLGDQSRVLVRRFRLTFLDRCGESPVQFGAIGLELSLIGHRTD
jgi:hypothetical protein